MQKYKMQPPQKTTVELKSPFSPTYHVPQPTSRPSDSNITHGKLYHRRLNVSPLIVPNKSYDMQITQMISKHVQDTEMERENPLHLLLAWVIVVRTIENLIFVPNRKFCESISKFFFHKHVDNSFFMNLYIFHLFLRLLAPTWTQGMKSTGWPFTTLSSSCFTHASLLPRAWLSDFRADY